MRFTLLLLVASAVPGTAPAQGLPARSSPAEYPVSASDMGVSIGAELMDADQVKGSFSTDLSEYAVIEVAVYPKNGSPRDVAAIDFALRFNGRMIRPAEPRAIAGSNQRRSNARRDDITLYPTVGVTTGSWGTGAGVGIGGAVGGNVPGPASTDRDRQTMQQELEDKGLPEGTVTKTVAGYLYFPVGKRKAASYDLEYELNDVKVKLTLPAKRP